MDACTRRPDHQQTGLASRDALQKSPDAIQAGTIEVLEAQKAAGVWK